MEIKRDPTDVVEAARGQPLREVGGKQEAGEAGEEEVVTVTGEGVTGAAAAAAAEEDLQTGRQAPVREASTSTSPSRPAGRR